MSRRPVLRALALGVLSAVGPAAASDAPDAARAAAAHAVALAANEAMAARAVTAAWTPGAPTLGNDWERDDWDWVDRAPSSRSDGQRSLVQAVAWSALLPGLGERYVGNGGRARFFHIAEAAIWSTFAYYRIQGTVRENSHIEYAQLNAGAATEQNSDYYEHIGFWLSEEEWYDIVRRDGRYRFPDDPAAQAAFFEETKRYDEGQSWAWPDDAARTRYRQLRSRTERSFRNARLAAGAAIFNRLASMVDALALARGHNRELREEARLELRVGPRNTADGLVIGPVLTGRY